MNESENQIFCNLLNTGELHLLQLESVGRCVARSANRMRSVVLTIVLFELDPIARH